MSAQQLRHPEQTYLDYDPFEGEEATLACRSVKLVRAHKAHPCFGGAGQHGDGHAIQPGEIYRHEKALVDGSFWGQYRMCIACMDAWLADLLPEEDDDE